MLHGGEEGRVHPEVGFPDNEQGSRGNATLGPNGGPAVGLDFGCLRARDPLEFTRGIPCGQRVRDPRKGCQPTN
jgi:hypothetical protein